MRGKLKIEYVDKATLKPYANNAKVHTGEQVEQIKASIKEFGFNDPIAIWGDEIVEGHGRLLAVMEMDIEQVPIIRLDGLTDEQRKAYALVHNQLTMNTGFDPDLLRIELEDISLNMLDYGFDTQSVADGGGLEKDIGEARLAERFIVPPFDVLDARRGEWLARKRAWREIVGDEGQARNVKAYNNKQSNDKNKYKGNGVMPSETSIFDPVLAEIIYTWFAPCDGAKCFDCFAGGTAFGAVAARLGGVFTGIELRQEQVDFNNEHTEGLAATYICDDGRNVLAHIDEDTQDLFFSCPPYFDLEVYSDLENDASNQKTYDDFYEIIDEAFTSAVKGLKDDRFAVVVCGDVRDKRTGAYYNFPSDIISTFQKAGLVLYNNIKLLTPIGNAQIRAARYMRTRKTAHVYQDVLVFYKGDTKNIKDIFTEVAAADVDELTAAAWQVAE